MARVATGSFDNTAKVWDAHTGAPLLELKGHTREVLSVIFSPDGTLLVTGSNDKTAKVWDARTGTPLFEFTGNDAGIGSLAFRSRRERLVTASYSKAKIWDTRTGNPLLDLKDSDHTIIGPLLSVAFSSDGKRVIAGGTFLGRAKIWDASTGLALVLLKAHSGNVTSIAYSPDGTLCHR